MSIKTRRPVVAPPDHLTRAEADAIAAELAPYSRFHLLTGAGFSKAWGGFLASELWAIVLRFAGRRPRIDALLHDELNFELALARAESDRSTYDDEDREALWQAVLNAFAIQDGCMRRAEQHYSNVLGNMVEAFVPRPSGTSGLFTLNQDLAMERFVLTGDSPPIYIPGVQTQEQPPWWFGRRTRSRPWTDPTPLSTVTEFEPEDFRRLRCCLLYVKLHGSADWRLGDTRLAVLGGAKEETIDRFPILQMNNAIFRAALTIPRKPGLIVVGYGFGDRHINDAIREGVTRNDLVLWIVDPRSPKSLKDQLVDELKMPELWNAVVGYSNESFTEFFDPHSSHWASFRGGRFLR